MACKALKAAGQCFVQILFLIKTAFDWFDWNQDLIEDNMSGLRRKAQEVAAELQMPSQN